MLRKVCGLLVGAMLLAATAHAQTPAVEPKVKWAAHPLGAEQAALSADGSIAIVLGADDQGAGSLKFFRVSDQKEIANKPASSRLNRALAINAAGTRVAWFADETAPVIADVASGRAVGKRKPPELPFSRGGYLAFSEKDAKLTAIDNSRLYQWKLEDDEPPTLLDLKRIVYAFAAFPNSDRAIIGHEEGNWRLLYLDDRKVHPFEQPTSFEALEAAAAPSGEQFVARNYEEAAIVWNVASLTKAGELPGTANLGRGVCYSPDGKLIAAPTGEGDEITLFQIPGGKMLARLTGLEKFITDVRFSADGKWLIGCDRQGQAAVWSVAEFAAAPAAAIDGRPEFAPRTWTSADGAYKIEARLISIGPAKVKLEKNDGSQIEVPINKLSDDDQALLRAVAKELE